MCTTQALGLVAEIATPCGGHCQRLLCGRLTLGALIGRGDTGKEYIVSNGAYHSTLRKSQFHVTKKGRGTNMHVQTQGGTNCEEVRAGEAGVCVLFVVIRGLRTDYGARTHRMSQSYGWVRS